jgi:HSP20 family protein
MHTKETGTDIQKSQQPVTRDRALHWMSPVDLMDEWIDELQSRSFWPMARTGGFHLLDSPLRLRGPSVDIIDRDHEICVKAEIPGVKKKDLSITLQDKVLTIKACSNKEHDEEKGNYFRREMQHGEWSRSLVLPTNVHSEKAKATFRDGVMEIVLPKEPGHTPTNIAID